LEEGKESEGTARERETEVNVRLGREISISPFLRPQLLIAYFSQQIANHY
jgi:hypothetical protein